MRRQHQSPIANQDSIVIGQTIFFACGMSRTASRIAERSSNRDSEKRENWAVECDGDPVTRLAGIGHSQPQLAESVSATEGASSVASGSPAARRGRR
jgi:hypothetical protein